MISCLTEHISEESGANVYVLRILQMEHWLIYDQKISIFTHFNKDPNIVIDF